MPNIKIRIVSWPFPTKICYVFIISSNCATFPACVITPYPISLLLPGKESAAYTVFYNTMDI